MPPAHGPSLEDPVYWLSKAEEARALAEKMKFPESRLYMLGLAKTYTRLAERIEARRGRQ